MFGILQSSQQKYSSYKWITNQESTSGGKLEVHDVRRVFEPISSRDLDPECNLISIFGRARQGKSFLMNCLAGQNQDIFKISNEKESCTQGIEISDLWLSLKDFSRIDGGKAVNGNIKIGFVDAEGQGDKDVSYDASLICPILLASKCVIFNWKGDLQKDNILNILGIMTQAAKNIKEEVSQSDLKGSTPTNPRTKKFGHLHIIFRDWQAVSSDEKSTYDLLFNMEEGEAAIVRNQIRQDVLASFESVRVWLFEAPVKLVSDLRQMLKFTNTTAKFKIQIRELRSTLSSQLMKPTVCSGITLTAKKFPPFIDQVVAALNTSGAVMPSSAFLTMLRAEMENFRDRHELEIKECVERVLAGIDEGPDSGAFPTEEGAFKLLTEELDNIQRIVDDDIQQHFVGELAAQVTADYPRQIQVIRENYEHQFSLAFKNKYSQWLITSRKVAEAMLDDEFQNIEYSLPLAESVLLEKANDLLVKAVNMVGGYEQEGNIHVQDSIDLIRRHHKALLDGILKTNEEKLSVEKEKATALIHSYIEIARQEISSTVSRLSRESPTGFELTVLKVALDKMFFDLRESLKGQLSESCVDSSLDDFFKTCEKLQVAMQKEYELARATAFKITVQSAIFEVSNKVKALIQADHEQVLPALQNYLRSMETEKIRDVSGWQAFEEEIFELFRNQIKTIIEETLKPFNLVARAEDELTLKLDDIKRSETFSASVQRFVDQIFHDTERKFSFANAPYSVSDAGIFKSYLKKKLVNVARSFATAAEKLQENLRKMRLMEEQQEEVKREQQEQERAKQRLEQERLKKEQQQEEEEEEERHREHAQSDVPMESEDDASMGAEDAHTNYSDRFGGDAIRRAVEEARLAEKKRTEEAIERTRARGDIPKNRRASKIQTPKKSVDQQRIDAIKHAKKMYGDKFMSTTPPLSEDEKKPRRSRRQSTDSSSTSAPQPPTPPTPPTPPKAAESEEGNLRTSITPMPDKKKRRASAAGFLPASDMAPPAVKEETVKGADMPTSAKKDPLAAAREEARRQEEERLQQILEARKAASGKKK